jgi:hypothetical protein
MPRFVGLAFEPDGTRDPNEIPQYWLSLSKFTPGGTDSTKPCFWQDLEKRSKASGLADLASGKKLGRYPSGEASCDANGDGNLNWGWIRGVAIQQLVGGMSRAE